MRAPLLSRILPAASFVLLAAVAAARPSPVRQQVGGTFTMNYSQMHQVPVGDADAHVVIADQATGSNRSTGRDAYMDGAEVTNTELADLTQGNGAHQGYVVFAHGGERAVTRWNGKVTTVLGPDKQPATTFEGTWANVSGTGRYNGARGQGTYRGRMTGQQSYVVEWKGEIEPGESAASR